MRLIDADALLREHCYALSPETKWSAELHKDSCDQCLKEEGVCGLEISGDTIWNAPTIEAEPIKHGRCLSKKARYFYCSECGYGVQDVYEGSYKHDERVSVFDDGKEWNYCPNCGAKMD